jgi:hypothetical protein
MSPTLGGPPFCTNCGYQDGAGSGNEVDLFSHTNLYDASDFQEGGKFSPKDGGATQVMPASKQPRAGRRHVPGESIFAPQVTRKPAAPRRRAGAAAKAPSTGRPAIVDEDSADLDVPRLKEAGAKAVPDVVPLREEALFLPRCKYCEKSLELEDVAGGVCRQCRRDRSKRRRRGVTLSRVARASVGTLAVCETLWIGALVILAAARAGTSQWQTADIVTLSLRGGLVLFAVFAAAMFARGHDWGAGAALALGPPAALLAALQLRSGAFAGRVDVSAAAAWLGAGAVGVLAALVAATCFSPGSLPISSLLDRKRRRRSDTRPGGSHGSQRASSVAGEDDASPAGAEGQSGRGSRRRGRARAVIGGIVAIAVAGLAGWQAALALSGKPKLGPYDLPAEVLLTPGAALVAAALCAAALGLWLLARPPAGRTHAGAVMAAAIAGGLPAWLLLGHFVLKADPARPLAIVSGAAFLVGVGSAAQIEGAVEMSVLVPAIIGTAVALGASLWTLFGDSAARGRALAGFALTWALAWGAGLAAAACL